MRFRTERHKNELHLRMFDAHGEIAYGILALRGLRAEIEFPSDWHEHRRVWVRIGTGIVTVAFSFPWSKVVPDEHQCSGPTYGFSFFGDGLHLHFGKRKGKRNDPFTIVGMPWRWNQRWHKVLSDRETHPYLYKLRSGEVQDRTATIREEARLYLRPWIPFRKLSRYIDIEFNDEVGEPSGTWKGGCIGCSYNMQGGETPLDTLRRMERERTF